MNLQTNRAQPYAIRLARQDELPKLQVIEHAAAQLFRDTIYNTIPTDDPMPLASLEHWFTNGKIWVAVDTGDEPIGFAVVHEVDGTAYLHELDIDPKHGRQGLGARLIEQIATWAQAAGYPSVTLSTFANVAWNAPYYRRLGFRVLGDKELGPGLHEILEHETANGLTDRVCMIRPVG
jgi:ribosomal protein S18 acetylase RimI-like enzyme